MTHDININLELRESCVGRSTNVPSHAEAARTNSKQGSTAIGSGGPPPYLRYCQASKRSIGIYGAAP